MKQENQTVRDEILLYEAYLLPDDIIARYLLKEELPNDYYQNIIDTLQANYFFELRLEEFQTIINENFILDYRQYERFMMQIDMHSRNMYLDEFEIILARLQDLKKIVGKIDMSHIAQTFDKRENEDHSFSTEHSNSKSKISKRIGGEKGE